MTEPREREIDRLPEAVPGRGDRRASREWPRLVALAAPLDEVTASLTITPPPSAAPLDLAAEIEAIDALLEPPRASEEGVRIDPARASASTLEAHYAGVVEGCVERLVLFTRQRFDKPLARVARVEARMLAQIDAIAEAGATPEGLLELFREGADGSPWFTWAVAFTLGCFAGRGSVAALLTLVEELGDDAFLAARLAGDALARGPHPGAAAWMRDALRSSSPAARAAGIELASIRGLLSIEGASAALRDPSSLVAAAGARAASRFAPAEESLVLGLRALLDHEDAEVTWQAASSLTLVGVDDGVQLVRERRSGAARLFARALDLLVLVGDLADFEVLMASVASLAASARTLDAVARFGHPGGRDYLLRHLDDDELGDHAAAALETLFGPRVASDADERAKAWREACGGAFDPTVRLRRGEPWSRRVVAVECTSRALSRRAVEGRLAELRVQSGVQAHFDIGGFAPEAEPTLRAALERYDAR